MTGSKQDFVIMLFLIPVMLPRACINIHVWLVVEYKRSRQEIKRATSDTVRLQKKLKKGEINIDCCCYYYIYIA